MRARELFEQARRASARIEELTYEMQLPSPPRSGAPGPTGVPGDPTARQAEWATDGRQAMARELDACERCVGEALALIEGVRRAIAAPWWRVLDAHYIDRQTFEEVAEALGVDRRTCMRWRDAACEWVDAMGFARAKMGEGDAQGI